MLQRERGASRHARIIFKHIYRSLSVRVLTSAVKSALKLIRLSTNTYMPHSLCHETRERNARALFPNQTTF